VLYDVVETLENCLFFNDRMLSQGKRPDEEQMLRDNKLATTRWINREEMEERLRESITEAQHEEFIEAIERLTFQYFSYKYKDFIFG